MVYLTQISSNTRLKRPALDGGEGKITAINTVLLKICATHRPPRPTNSTLVVVEYTTQTTEPPQLQGQSGTDCGKMTATGLVSIHKIPTT